MAATLIVTGSILMVMADTLQGSKLTLVVMQETMSMKAQAGMAALIVSVV